MPTHKFAKLMLAIILLFAVPFFLMVYCLRCERLRLSSQKRLIERLIEKQRQARRLQECEDDEIEECDVLPERY